MSPLALVTGATKGIGRAVCEALLKRGRTVVATGRDAVALAALETAHPGRVVGISADLSQPDEWRRLLDRAERHGGLDELVLSAGIVHYAGIDTVSEADLRAQHELNFVVPFLITRRVGLAMRERGQGAVVHIASTLGMRAAPHTAAYAASKAALLSATRSFALELAPSVRVNAVAPGVVDTAMVRVPRGPVGGDPAGAVASQLESLRRLHPLGRLGTPADVAEAVVFLLQAPWITGSVLTVDGGLTAA